MNAGLDFALAQVRDRDLVIESLREQHKTLGDHAANMERLLEAAEAKLNAHAIEISQHKGDLARAEAKLAEEEPLTATFAVEQLKAKLAEVEKEAEAMAAHIVEVEKELEELRKGDI